MFKPSASPEICDWISPAHVQVVKVATSAAQFERFMQKVQELRERMGPRYLCNEKNRVQRLDGKTYKPKPISANVLAIKRKEVA